MRENYQLSQHQNSTKVGLVFDLIYLAILNTLRNTRRSVITILSISVGCAALTCFGGFINFTFEGLRETTIRTQLGHLQIYAKDYSEKRISDLHSVLIHNIDDLITTVESIEGVSSVTPRLAFSGIGGAGKNTVNMTVKGVDPIRDVDFADFEIVIDGRNLVPGDEDVGVIGSELAKGIDANVGDWVTVMTTSLDGVFNVIDFQVIGIVRTGSAEYDSVFVKVPIKLARRALNTNSAERLLVLLHATDSLPRLRPHIEEAIAKLPEKYEMRQWDELAAFYEAVVTLYTGLFRVFALIIGIVVMFSVSNTMTMAVFERTSESGALRAIGANQQIIVKMFLYEGIFIGILGGVFGVLLSLAIAWFVDLIGGIEMPPPPSMSEGYQAYFLMTPEVLFVSFTISALTAVISSVYPAWSASRTNIVEALQKQ